MFKRFRKQRRDDGAPAGAGSGFFPLYETQQPVDPDYDTWDAQLAELDESIEREERRRLPFWRPAYWRTRRKRWWAVRIFAGVLALVIVLSAWLAITAPLSKSLEPIAPPQITLLASDGTPIARRGAMVETPVAVADLPPHVVQAFLAIEDRRFYSHWGIDPRGIARAAWTGRGGGSTITQQLAKFTFLTPEQSLSRKAREALIALWLEGWLTKDEILERYLSNAYFGDNQYGLRAASLHYFYRQPENLLPQQAAMLAGLLQAPSRYAPTKHYDRAKTRMDQVIGAMVDAGYLTPAQAAQMPAPRLDVRRRDDLPTGTYFADWALPIARDGLEPGYARQVLTTTLDARLQALASRVTSRAQLGGAQVALVAMRPTGEVVAMVGGKDYAASPFNRATQAKRQPGSTFKLFVYLAALEAGWAPDDRIENTAITNGSYRPKNASENYSETLSLEEAFARSSNVAAVRLQNEVGSDQVIRMARGLGIESPMVEGDPSLALGTSTMTLLELTAAYAGVAANRFPVTPRAFDREEAGWLDWLRDRRERFSPRTHAHIEQMLRAVLNQGTGSAAALPIANYGKTGTTQDNRDALFVGYAGDLVVGVWIGNDDNSPMGAVTGGGSPARIWKDFMRGALSLPEARPSTAPDPEGPVQPLDIEEGEEMIYQGEGARVRIGPNGIDILSDDAPIGVRIDREGVRVEGLEEEIERRTRQRDEAAERLRERIEAERERIETEIEREQR
ncbi:MAG: transglycosylase domain-containing protein [Erythrobacter sp.]|jgi:penicillin-binding protein 1A|nr:transglycosylase domain-containing protein [Erythrobacter sp.]